MKRSGFRFQVSAVRRYREILHLLKAGSWKLTAVPRGFTLIETLVAVMLLSVAIVAPMSLASKSLSTAYYARDQITAFYLAQEAIEAVRSIRDSQILTIAENPAGAPDIFGPIPHNNQPFIIDARKGDPATAIVACNGTCPPLETNGTLYGYPSAGEDTAAWTCTCFTRTVYAHPVGGNQDEIRVTVTVTWQTGSIQARTFSISENLFRWVNDGSGQQ